MSGLSFRAGSSKLKAIISYFPSSEWMLIAIVVFVTARSGQALNGWAVVLELVYFQLQELSMKRVENFLWNSRFIVLSAVVASLAAGIAIFYITTIDVYFTLQHVSHYADLTVDAREALRDEKENPTK
jgi:hypothetical protein